MVGKKHIGIAKSSELGVREKIYCSIAELEDEYIKPHNHPWVVGFSGGKDSTLLLHLILEMLQKLPVEQKSRPIHVVSNDTLVESPVLINHIDKNLDAINHYALQKGVPITAEKTTPDVNQTFWVNLIGRGYPSPNQKFRWCTDRMKIQPTSAYIRAKAMQTGEVILLLGVRESESSARASSIKRYSTNSRLNKHNSLKDCYVFRPIVDFTTEEVWHVLLQRKKAPWGIMYRELITLYRNAEGGECPTVTDKSEAPSCGSSSARFGCWTCTVVDKDRSLAGMIEAGFENLEPLLDFRDWLHSIRNKPNRRLSVRRNGKATVGYNGKLIPGPFTICTRREIYNKLRDAERESGRVLITAEETNLIYEIWATDAIEELERRAKPVGGLVA